MLMDTQFAFNASSMLMGSIIESVLPELTPDSSQLFMGSEPMQVRSIFKF